VVHAGENTDRWLKEHYWFFFPPEMKVMWRWSVVRTIIQRYVGRIWRILIGWIKRKGRNKWLAILVGSLIKILPLLTTLHAAAKRRDQLTFAAFAFLLFAWLGIMFPNALFKSLISLYYYEMLIKIILLV
jgi:uncharacterized membrane protein